MIVCLALLMLLLPIVSAIDTEINVKTIPDHEVQITVSKSNSLSFYALEGGRFSDIADEYGDIQFIFSNLNSLNLVN